jgi:hypothetical protein
MINPNVVRGQRLQVHADPPLKHLQERYPRIPKKQLIEIVRRKGPLSSDIERELQRINKGIKD